MGGAVQAILEQLVGGQFAVEESTVTVTTTVAELLRNDPERVDYLIVNTGATELLVAWSRPGGAANAIPIAPDGGSLTVNVLEDYILPTHSLLASVAVGSTTVLVVTVRRTSE